MAFYLRGESQNDTDVYVMINAAPQDITFRIQQGTPGSWKRVADTSLASPGDIVEPGQEELLPSTEYPVKGRSVVVLIRG